MTPWTSLLESIHSALIDELTERHPKPKPELGMPVRKTDITLPDQRLESTLLISVEMDDSRGIVMLSFQNEFMKALHTDPQEFWRALGKRSGTEFARRNILPRFAKPELLEGALQVQDRAQTPLRVVWIPFKLPAGTCYLGLAA